MVKRSRSRSHNRSRKQDNRQESRIKKCSKWSDLPPQHSQNTNNNSQNDQNHQAAITISGLAGSQQTGSGPLIAPYSLLTQLLNWVHPLVYLSDPLKQKRKLLLENLDKYNELILGPKNTFKKYLEKTYKVNIYLRGKHLKDYGIQNDEEEPTHILIVSDTFQNIQKCSDEIENILSLQDEKLKEHLDQLQIIFEKNKNDPNNAEEIIEQIILQGTASPNAYIFSVPNDCLSLLIGKNADTLKMIQNMSNIDKIYIQNEGIPGNTDRNVYIEGDIKGYNAAKQMLTDIIDKHKQLKNVSNIMGFSQNMQNNVNPTSLQAKQTIELSIPNNMVGLVQWKSGETIKSINQRTGAYVFIPPDVRYGETTRSLTITGMPDQCQVAKNEILDIVTMGQSVQGYKMEADINYAYQTMQQQKQFDQHVQATKEIRNIPFLEQAFQNAPPDQDLTNPFALSGLMPNSDLTQQNEISQYQSALLVYQDMLNNQLQPSVIESTILDDQSYYAGISKSQQRNPKFY